MTKLLLFVLATAGDSALALADATTGHRCATADGGGDDLGLLQLPSYKAEESILDFTMADAGALENESASEEAAKGIDEAKWADMFKKLDSDGDGIISASDLDRDSFVEASPDVKRMNVTKQQVADALGLIASWEPKLAPYLVKNSQLLVFTAWTGQKPPAGLPEPPEDPLEPEEEEEDDERRLWEFGPCQEAILKTILPTVNLLLSALAIRIPGGKFPVIIARYARKSTKFLKVVEKIVKALGGPTKIAGSRTTMANFIFKVGKELWNTGLLRKAIKETARSLSWWQKTTIIVPALAAIASFFVTGGTANLVIAIGLGGISVIDLGLALKDVAKDC